MEAATTAATPCRNRPTPWFGSYRDILDSGATGLCPFYYADGWWKAGAPSIHNDEAEEWFGFFGFRDVKDTTGYPRPAWHALRQYNEALISSPKNQQFYQNEVPIEVFCQPDVMQLRVIHLDNVVLTASPDARGRVSSHLSFSGERLKDRELVIEAYGRGGRLLKTETIIVLTGPEPVRWPTLELATSATDLESLREVPATLTVRNATPFSLGDEVRWAFSYHKGWDRAEARTQRIDPAQKEQTLRESYLLPAETPMLAIYAGTDISFGKFRKTVVAHRYLYRGNWADPIRIKD